MGRSTQKKATAQGRKLMNVLRDDLNMSHKAFEEFMGISRGYLSEMIYGNRSGAQSWEKVWGAVEILKQQKGEQRAKRGIN